MKPDPVILTHARKTVMPAPAKTLRGRTAPGPAIARQPAPGGGHAGRHAFSLPRCTTTAGSYLVQRSPELVQDPHGCGIGQPGSIRLVARVHPAIDFRLDVLEFAGNNPDPLQNVVCARGERQTLSAPVVWGHRSAFCFLRGSLTDESTKIRRKHRYWDRRISLLPRKVITGGQCTKGRAGHR
jgi:hypothetical protein